MRLATIHAMSSHPDVVACGTLGAALVSRTAYFWGIDASHLLRYLHPNHGESGRKPEENPLVGRHRTPRVFFPMKLSLSFASSPLPLPATCSDDKSVCIWDVSAISVALRVSKAKRLKEAKAA